ncbi:PP2C family protein-serine/threonine phosphatase [Dyella sp. C9]|uniref:PP2C family protein-serine/threonine phosphatase n=1 Tax=Dyella sp. C9 TaxID=2202154 RepID=UPI000DEF75FB|nr:SpoIIE family protein phosphatase [Dyella sp. C9]
MATSSQITPIIRSFGQAEMQCAANLCRPVPTVASTDTNATVRDLFDQHRELISLPVVDGTRVRGLIKRHTFQSEMAKPFRQELHEHKSCVAFMDRQPLVIEADTSLERTAKLVADSQTNALADGFLVVRDNEFLGIGFGLDLMGKVADLQEAKNRQIMQSIDYASVIQRAMLQTSQEVLKAELPNSAIVWQPRDTVGGDFFQCAKFDQGVFIAMGDCTGHGVPGAFMTLISSSWLAQALERDDPANPAQLLGTLNHKIKQSLGQIGSRAVGEQSDDGLDALFMWINLRDRVVTYAGARMPLHVLSVGAEMASTHETDRVGVGYVATPIDYRWTNRTLSLQQNDLLYAATDGLTDQIGGPRNISFGKRRLRQLLHDYREMPAPVQADAIVQAHVEYQGQHRRRDDVSLICLRVP